MIVSNEKFFAGFYEQRDKEYQADCLATIYLLYEESCKENGLVDNFNFERFFPRVFHTSYNDLSWHEEKQEFMISSWCPVKGNLETRIKIKNIPKIIAMIRNIEKK